ncbi:unnamed protein product [Linum trigynum]|uniref:Uncharacterized protein n=1 Tax=Linum trigynum TaxID=586398 RepID=A0AAV2EZ40_9ROSI
MADSWEELVGENDPGKPAESPHSFAAVDGDQSVAKDVFFVYDSDDADTSDDEYHAARDNLRTYGEMRKRKVKARSDYHGEEVEQLDEFEEEDSEDEEDDEVEHGGQDGDAEASLDGADQGSEIPEQACQNNDEPPQHEAREEISQHSSYRGSEDSDHVRPNLSDEDGGEPFANAPHYDPMCDHTQFQFVPRLKFANVEQLKNAVVLHSLAAELV